MIIVIDTNIWLAENLLRSPKGLSITAYCINKSKNIMVPEIIEKETEVNFVREAVEARSKIKEQYDFLLMAMGKLKELVMPTDEEIKATVSKRYEELSTIIIREPFTFQQAQKALEMVINYLPPNSKGNQQFKDSAIWSAILDKANLSDIDFITNDKGFFKDKSPSLGLADSIMADIEHSTNTIRVHFGLSAFLSMHFKATEIVNTEKLGKEIIRIDGEKIRSYVDEFGITVQNISFDTVSSYLTGRDGIFSIEYVVNVEFEVSEITPPEPVFRISGNCVFNSNTGTVTNNCLTKFEFEYKSETNETLFKTNNYGYFSGNIVLGHKTIEYDIKHKIS